MKATESRHYSFFDRLLVSFDQSLKTLTNQSKRKGVKSPGREVEEPELTEENRRHAAALMRINHTGEICAQALYHGQGLVSKSKEIKDKMDEAAREEGDHLAWCKQRLDELQSHTSYLNPFWYSGSFCMGFIVGMVGDAWSLGFVAETERQVGLHLQKQLRLLPKEDERSYRILKQMEMDEAVHLNEAMILGAKDLPKIVRQSMSLLSKIMVKMTYWI